MPVARRDRRKFPRRKTRESMIVITASGYRYRALCRDVSDGGVGAIVISADLDISERVSLEYYDGEGATTRRRAPAVVANRRGTRYGFALLESMTSEVWSNVRYGRYERLRKQPARAEVPARALLVEDDQGTMEFLRECLQGEGFQCVQAAEGWAAAKEIQAGEFDLILIDLLLPGPDAYYLAKLARQSTTNARAHIVIVTGSDERGALSRAFAAGASCFLHKPLTRSRLLAVLTAFRLPNSRAARLG